MEQPSRSAPSGLARSVADHAPGDHLVTFYEYDADVVRDVTAFLAPAIEAGDAGMIVVTPQRRRDLLDGLTEAGIDVAAARSEDRLVVVDAEALLAQLLADGPLDTSTLQARVGAELARATAGGRRVHLFGEMVTLLWERGHLTAVVELERAWNDVAERVPLVVFCAYPLHDVAAEGSARALRDMIACHTHVLPFRDPDAGAALRNDFASMVVHDIQSPATVVTALLGMLRSGWRDMPAEALDDHLDTALRSIRRIERLTADIMTAARLDAGTFTYELRPMHIGAAIERAAQEVSGATGRHIERDLPGGLPQVLADPDRQLQVLINLLTNAVKFSSDGSLVSVSVSTIGDHLAVHVRDEGIGIAEDEQPGLFLPFSRLRRADRQVRGTGLGLHTARSLVEGQGGRIWVESEPGKGSTFSYTVPLA